MNAPHLVGSELPALQLPPLARATLALYAGGSGDHVPFHIDSAYAKSVGYPDVFMHGMLGMAYLGRLLTEWMPQHALREWSVRFVAITYPGEALTAKARVVGWVEGAPNRLTLEVSLENERGEKKLAGRAVVDSGTAP